jgi:hypothetical protein
MALTNNTKNTVSLTNKQASEDITWDEADFTWDETNSTWDKVLLNITEQTKNTITLTKPSENNL